MSDPESNKDINNDSAAKDKAAADQKSKNKNSKDTNVENKGDVSDEWPLQADRLAMRNPLVECLRILAGHHGRRTSTNALTAGLPIKSSGITPLLFLRAAERADMRANLAERSLESLAIAPNLPCIITLEHGQACVIWDIKMPVGKRLASKKKAEKNKNITIHPDTEFIVQFPETKDEKPLKKELKKEKT